MFPDKKFLIAVAGGIVPETAKEALDKGADILIVGRYVTQSKDIIRSVRDFLELTPKMLEDIDLFQSSHRINKKPNTSFFLLILLSNAGLSGENEQYQKANKKSTPAIMNSLRNPMFRREKALERNLLRRQSLPVRRTTRFSLEE